jgi:hypothetical protein
MSQILKFDYARQFGVEIEVNAFDGRSDPLDEKKLPEGIYYISNLISKNIKKYIEIHRWSPTHWNNRTPSYWVVKPDASCGIEICSPVSKGWYGLKEICKVADVLADDKTIRSDSRCSLHVHIDVSDLEIIQISNILSWWIKSEPVFVDSVPFIRKNNRYCQYFGLWDLINHDSILSSLDVVRLLGRYKYYSINTYHLRKGDRSTIEFRLCESSACLDSYILKNWVMLLLHFVECTKDLLMPGEYKEGDRWSGWAWLEAEDVFKLLKFNTQLSQGFSRMRNWFLARILHNLCVEKEGIYSLIARGQSYVQTKELYEKLVKNTSIYDILSPKDKRRLVYEDSFNI